jgi:hypothetical protein
MTGKLPSVRVTDRALVRFLDRAGRLDVEGLRAHLASSLAQAARVARRLGAGHTKVCVDGLGYCLEPDPDAPGQFVLVSVVEEAERRGKTGRTGQPQARKPKARKPKARARATRRDSWFEE